MADCGNHRLKRFTAEGQLLKPVAIKGVKDIAIDARNGVVYVLNHSVQVLNSNFKFSITFGEHGKSEGEFDCPSAIACDSTGNVYVADSSNNRIQVFTSAGKFLRMFGSHGKGRGELNWPVSIALDAEDNVYVSDRDNHRVSVFTSGGRFVTSFGKKGEGPGEFCTPCGLAVDNGVVYVCDYGNNRLQLF